jgi:hypothetical protein
LVKDLVKPRFYTGSGIFQASTNPLSCKRAGCAKVQNGLKRLDVNEKPISHIKID